MKKRRPILAPGWISMPVSHRPQLETTLASHFQPERHNACATRCSQTACRPGQQVPTSKALRAAGSRWKTLWISSRMRSNICLSPLVVLAAHSLLGFREDATQDIHFQLADRASPIQTTQPRHQVTRLLRIEKTNGYQDALQVP